MPVDFYLCPTCDTEVEVGSEGCPVCNAGEDRYFNGDGVDLDLPEDDLFDYDDFVSREFGEPEKKTPMQWVWWIAAVLLLLSFVLVYVI